MKFFLSILLPLQLYYILEQHRLPEQLDTIGKKSHKYLLFTKLGESLRLDLLADSCFNSLVLFLSDLFSHLSVGWVSAQNEGIDHGHDKQSNRHNLSKQVVIRPSD